MDTGKEKIVLPLFSDNMIFYVGNSHIHTHGAHTYTGIKSLKNNWAVVVHEFSLSTQKREADRSF